MVGEKPGVVPDTPDDLQFIETFGEECGLTAVNAFDKSSHNPSLTT